MFDDYHYKSNKELSTLWKAVVSAPDMAIRERADGEDMHMVLAWWDIMWDAMSNDEAWSFMAQRVVESLDWVGSNARGVGGAETSLKRGTNCASGKRAVDSVQ